VAVVVVELLAAEIVRLWNVKGGVRRHKRDHSHFDLGYSRAGKLLGECFLNGLTKCATSVLSCHHLLLCINLILLIDRCKSRSTMSTLSGDLHYTLSSTWIIPAHTGPPTWHTFSLHTFIFSSS